jgi:hypothetical protein
MNERRFRFRAADCETITDELSLVDWDGIFLSRIDLCVDLVYDVLYGIYGLVLKNLCREPQLVVPRNFRTVTNVHVKQLLS